MLPATLIVTTTRRSTTATTRCCTTRTRPTCSTCSRRLDREPEPHQLLAVHPRHRPVPQIQPGAARRDPEGKPAALHRRALLRAPGALHLSELPHRSAADLQFGHRMAADLVADGPDPRRSRLRGVRRVDFDITPKLSGTVGYRFYRYDNSLDGFFGFGANNSFGSSTGENQNNPAASPPTCVTPGILGGPCVDLAQEVKKDGSTPKFNLTYKFDEDHMVYATFSKGFRPGGVNRRQFRRRPIRHSRLTTRTTSRTTRSALRRAG